LRARGIRQRPQQIKNGSNANLLSRGSRMPRSRVRSLRKQKSDANLADRAPIPFERQINPHPQRFQHVCRTASRTGRAIPMLCDARARRRGNDRRRRRNIKRVRTIATGSARVHHVRGLRFAVRKHPCRMPPHHTRKSREFLNLDGPPIERRQQSHNLWRFHASRKQLLHCRFCFRALEHMPGLDSLDQQKCHRNAAAW
jgi:hypothetical protein